MKAKKKVLSLFLVVALLAVGVGYAIVTDVLAVNGTISVNGSGVSQFNESIHFKDSAEFVDSNSANVVAGTTASTHTLNSAEDIMTLTIPEGHLLAPGDTVTVTMVIQNLNNFAVPVQLTAPESNVIAYRMNQPTQPLITFEAKWKLSDGKKIDAKTSQSIPAAVGSTAGELTLEVVFKLEATPVVQDQARVYDIDLSFTATRPESTP